MTSDRRLDRLDVVNRRRREAGAEPLRIDGASSMRRLGALPATSRIAKTIAHNRAIRQRLIAGITASAARTGHAARIAADVRRLTNGASTSLSDLSLAQLRRVAGEQRRRASSPSAHGGLAADGGGDAAAGGLGAAGRRTSSPSPRKDTRC